MRESPESADADDRRVISSDASLVEKAYAALGVVRRQKWILGICAVLGLVLGGAVLLTTPPVYVAQALLLFDRANRPVVTQSVLTDTPLDASFFESQVQILHSDSLMLAVVRKLDLAKDPEFVSGGVLTSLMNSVRSASTTPAESLQEMAAGRLSAKLDVKRVGVTYFLEVTLKSKSAAKAEQVLQALIDEYISGQQAARFEAARTASRWLEQRLDELRMKAAVDEQAVNDYKAKNQIVSATGGLIGEQSLAAMNSELVSARAKASDALARLDRIEAVLRANDADLGVNATVSDALSSPIITKLRQDYLTLAAKEAEYTPRYGAGHLAVVAIRDKVRSIQKAIRSELRRLAENSKSEYLIAKKRQENIEKELSASVAQSQSTNRAQVSLRALESAAQNSRSLYNLFQARFLETTQQQSMSISDVQQMGKVGVSDQKPGYKIAGMAMLGGIAVGAGIGFLREAVNRVLRTSRQVEKALGLPCVALVPILPGAAGPVTKDGSAVDEARTLPTTITTDMVARMRFSPFTESIRCIKLAGDLTLKPPMSSNSSRQGLVVGITSSVPSEGKSTIAMSLAQMAASVGQRAIVVDCDLRNPSLSRSYSPLATAGLVEVLSNQIALQDAVWTDANTKLAFLPMAASQSHDPAEVMASPHTAALIESLRKLYDYVVVDFSPLAPAAELSASATLVDGYFFVVEWGQTKVEIITRALSGAPEVYEKAIGVVLTKVDMTEVQRYDSYDYNRYNYKYY